MATIAEDLQHIMESRYGREVRQAIHDAIHDINEVAEGAKDSATASATSAQGYASNAAQSASNAETDAITSSNNATLSESWAVGGTNTRSGEDTNNSKYWSEEAERIVGTIAPIDNLNSTSTTQPLSANQGRVLDGKITNLNNKIGNANGVASLDGNGRVPYSQLPESAMEFKGTWNASTNAPTLTSGVGTNGDFYVVSVGGTWNNITFNPNDRILFDGITAHDWIRLVAGEVNSVNGQSGAVQLNANGIPFDNTGSPMQSTNVEDAVKEAFSNGGVDVAPPFDTTVAYGVGDYVTYNNKTYRFKSIHSIGAWDNTQVDEIYIAGQYVTAGKRMGSVLGKYSTVEGLDNVASGRQSHAEGEWTLASKNYSHAEGFYTEATGDASHAEGAMAKAKGDSAHAEGESTLAEHEASHAEGYSTQTGADYQHVQGKYNIGKSTTLFEIGNGTGDNARSNAFEVDTSGNVLASGTISAGGFMLPVNPLDTSNMNIWIEDENE